MTANRAEYPVETMARSMGVSRSGFYSWQAREPSARDIADRELTNLIRQIHAASRESYGAPRIHAELADSGVHVGRKRVERLMKAASLAGVSRRRSARTTIRDERVRPSADLVDRNFYADGPNMLWVADITYVPTWAGFLYLAVVLDAARGELDADGRLGVEVELVAREAAQQVRLAHARVADDDNCSARRK